MRIALFAPLALLVAPLTGCAGNGADQPLSAESQAGLDKALAGRVAGPATSCIPITYRSLNTKAYGRTLLYQQASGTIFRNDTAGGCENAGRGDILVQVEQEGRPCSGDIIRTVDQTSHIQTGSCALGQFIPYEKPSTRH